MAADRPNILWISFEDTNPFYGCYGDAVARTPHVDALAASGCRYPQAFSTAGVCAPARSAIITGLYPTSQGSHHMRTVHQNRATPEMPTPYDTCVPHYAKCFTEYLRAAGYYCCNNVKTDYQFTPPRTAWDDCSTEAHWRNRPDSDQPFFAVWNPTMTHESGMWEGKVEPTFDPDAIELPPYFPDTPKVRKAMAQMYTNIEQADAVMGQLLAELEEDGLADNTIVMHWSDHGPLPRGKRWPYDSGIHVPMIVRWPGELEAGSVSQQLVSTIDLGPTVLSLAGVPIPLHMQGRAFLGDQEDEPREYIHASRDRHDEAYDMVRAVRDRRFKYMRHFRADLPYLLWIPYRNNHPILQEMWRLHLADELTGPQTLMFQPRPREELYDTLSDPWEIHNLADDPAFEPELARLREELEVWRSEVGDLGEMSELEMKRTWYPDGDQPVVAAPICVPICEGNYGRQPVSEATLPSPCLVQLHCATQGASIAYTTAEGEDAHWLLYTQPLRLAAGTTILRTRAARIGYQESREASFRLTVQS